MVGPISPHRALAVATAWTLSLAVAMRYAVDGDALIPLFAVNVLVVIAVSDVETRRIPNRIVLPAWALVLIANTALESSRWAEWILGGVVAAAAFLAFGRLTRGGLGMGDVKLAGFLGALLGHQVLSALLLGSAASAIYAGGILLRHGLQGRRHSYALGPFLAGGATAVLLV